MPDHGALVVQITDGDLDYLVSVVFQPGADQLVVRRRRRVAVNVLAQAI